MNKNIQLSKPSFFRLFLADIKWSFSPFRLLTKLLFPLIIVLFYFLVSWFNPQSIKATEILLLTVSLFIMVSMLMSLGKDKPTLDKNKAKFIYFNKHQVVFSKLISEVILFMTIFLIASISMMMSVQPTDLLYYTYISLGLMMAASFYYAFIYMISTWLLTFFGNGYLGRFIAFIVAIIGLSFILLKSILKYVFPDAYWWFLKNEKIIAFIPIINFASFFTFVSGNLQPTLTIFPILYMMIFMSSTWVLYTNHQKRFMVS